MIKKTSYTKKNILFILIGLFSLSLMLACSKDDETDNKGANLLPIENENWTITIEDGNVVLTIKNDGFISKTIYVYQNGKFDHAEAEIHCPTEAMAQYLYNDMLLNEELMQFVQELQLKGNIIYIFYKDEYAFSSFAENLTAEELKIFLEENFATIINNELTSIY